MSVLPMLTITPRVAEFSGADISIQEITDFYRIDQIKLLDERPYTWSNSLQSLDGYLHFLDDDSQISDIGLERVPGIGHLYPADHRLLAASWTHADAVLVSAECVRSEPEILCTITYPDLKEYRIENLKKAHNPVQVILSQSGVFPINRPMFHVSGLDVWIFTSNHAKASLDAAFDAEKAKTNSEWSTIRVISLESLAGYTPSESITTMLLYLKQHGIDFLDVSSGGKVINSFINAGILDELRTTISGQICGPLNLKGAPRPRLFPTGQTSSSYSASSSPLVAWVGIRYLATHLVFYRGILEYRHLAVDQSDGSCYVQQA